MNVVLLFSRQWQPTGELGYYYFLKILECTCSSLALPTVQYFIVDSANILCFKGNKEALLELQIF